MFHKILRKHFVLVQKQQKHSCILQDQIFVFKNISGRQLILQLRARKIQNGVIAKKQGQFKYVSGHSQRELCSHTDIICCKLYEKIGDKVEYSKRIKYLTHLRNVTVIHLCVPNNIGKNMAVQQGSNLKSAMIQRREVLTYIFQYLTKS